MRIIKLVAVLLIFVVPFSVLAAASKQKYKTYKNTAGGYSVKYPSHWRPHEQEYDASYIYFDYGKEQISIPDQSTAVTIGPTPIGSDSFYTSENLDEIAKISVEVIEANRFGDQDLRIRVKNTKIGKFPAKQINYINSFVYEKRLEMVQFLFVKDGAVWTIGGPAKEKGLRQILKSLQFIRRAGSIIPVENASTVKQGESVDCDNNIDCFIESSKFCALGKFTFHATEGGKGDVLEISTNSGEVKGISNGKCVVFFQNQDRPELTALCPFEPVFTERGEILLLKSLKGYLSDRGGHFSMRQFLLNEKTNYPECSGSYYTNF